MGLTIVLFFILMVFLAVINWYAAEELFKEGKHGCIFNGWASGFCSAGAFIYIIMYLTGTF